MTEPVSLIILDCDGVLVDSEPIAVRVDAEALAEVGWPLSEAEIIERFVGRSQEYLVNEAERHLGRRLPPGWSDELTCRLLEAFSAELRPVADVVEALDNIRLPICVASSGSHRKIEHSLRLTGLLPRFRGRIFSTDDVEHGKPAPDLFLHAAGAMGVPVAEAVVVEDSASGVAAARRAGMRVLGYVGGLASADGLSEATRVFSDMRDLPHLVSSLQESKPLVSLRSET